MKKNLPRVLLIIALIIVALGVILFWYLAYLNQPMSYVAEGDLPFHRRQNMEEYVEKIAPAIEEFKQALVEAGESEFIPLENSGQMPCGNNQRGRLYDGGFFEGPPVSVFAVKQLAEKYLVPVGVDHLYENRPDETNDHTTLKWFDVPNGGFVSVTVYEGTKTYLNYTSSCRPTTTPWPFNTS